MDPMRQSIKINNGKWEERLEMPCKDGVFIEIHTSSKAYGYVCVYNENGKQIGVIGLNTGFFPTFLYLSETKKSLNALPMERKTDIYTFCGYHFGEIQEEETLVITYQDLSGDEAVQQMVDRGYRQEDLFYHPMVNRNYLVDNHGKDASNRYYKGDFHGHTTFSDGHIPFSQAGDLPESYGMDFMAWTEHNMIPTVTPTQSISCIPSFELTLPEGHINIHGLKELEILSRERMQHISEILGGNDRAINMLIDSFGTEVNISLNHMFMEPWHCTMDQLDIGKLNTIEVICDPTYTTAGSVNTKAVRFLDFLWNKGIHLYGIGGSDCHLKPEERYENQILPSRYGDPATYVHSQGNGTSALIRNVKKGHMYVARFVDLDITIGEGGYLPGDRISDKDMSRPFAYKIEVNHYGQSEAESLAVQKWEGRLIIDGICMHKALLAETDTFTYEDIRIYIPLVDEENQWSSRDYHWIRFGIYDEKGEVTAYVNPVYIGDKKPLHTLDEAHRTLGHYIKEFDQHD